jgi:hypothetical protein
MNASEFTLQQPPSYSVSPTVQQQADKQIILTHAYSTSIEMQTGQDKQVVNGDSKTHY